MSEQIFLDALEPMSATGPWTALVDEAPAGNYLVKRADNEEYDVFICDGDGSWICMTHFGEQRTPLEIAQIFDRKVYANG